MMQKLFKYRNAFKAGAFIGLGVSVLLLLFITATTLAQSQRNGAQIKQQLAQLKEQSNDRAQAVQILRGDVNRLNDHVDCVVSLFTYPNHTNITIQDIKGCKLQTYDPQPTSYTPPTTKQNYSQKLPRDGANPSSTSGSHQPSVDANPKGFVPTVIESLRDLIWGVL